jgi:diguanylate cyclase (GGDEF)-like protein
MALLELPPGDIAYFALRMMLSVLSVAAAVTCVRFAWEAQRDGWPWRLAAAGGVLLVAGAVLSANDAILNGFVDTQEPVTWSSWLWFFLFDLQLPIWTLLLISAWRTRDHALSELSRLSATDQLTGALNRRGFLERAGIAIAQAQRAGQPAAMIMFDIDHFKSVNDSFGHAAGDDVLRGVVSVLAAGMRPGDLLGRLGGEEFAVYLHNSTEAAGVAIADRLRTQVRSNVVHPAGAGGLVTVSGGVASVPNGFEPETALTLSLRYADEALYTAKHEGRDRIVSIEAVHLAGDFTGTARHCEEWDDETIPALSMRPTDPIAASLTPAR